MSRNRKAEIRDADFDTTEAEKMVIGVMMNSLDTFFEWHEQIQEDHFSVPVHRRIWKALCVVAKRNHPLTPTNIRGVMEKADDAGIETYMRALKAEHAKIRSITSAFERMAEMHARRSAQILSQRLADIAIKGDVDASAEWVKQQVAAAMVNFQIAADGRKTARSLGELTRSVVNSFDRAYRGEGPTGVTAKLTEFNELVGSMLPGNLIILAGAVSSGKTALISQIGEEAAEKGFPTGQMQAEMGDEEVARRHLSKAAQIPSNKIVSGRVTQEEYERIIKAERSFDDLPYYIDATRPMRLSNLVSRARRMKREHGIRFLLIDHLLEIKPDRGSVSNDDKFEHIEEVIDTIKNLAVELEVPALVAAQFKMGDTNSFEVKRAKDIRRPHMGMLFGGNAVRYKADTIIFVHRPEYYLARAKPAAGASHEADWAADMARWQNKAELILNKLRGGDGFGVREIEFHGATTEFRSVMRPQKEEAEEALWPDDSFS